MTAMKKKKKEGKKGGPNSLYWTIYVIVLNKIKDFIKNQTGKGFFQDKYRRILEILGDSEEGLIEMMADIVAKEEESPFLKKASRIMDDILRKKRKDKDLNDYQFHDPSDGNDIP